jgi:hypothetical protein
LWRVKRWLAHAIAAVQVNRVEPMSRDQQDGYLKQRRWGMSAVIVSGNIFLWLARSRIQMFVSAAAWQAWECHGYALLYQHPCFPVGQRAIWMAALPGQSLEMYRAAGTLTRDHLILAAHEFRRVHGLYSDLAGRTWSHGDAHLKNMLYDAATHQVRLIDFETQHSSHLTEAECHADDVLVVVLDILGSELPEWCDLCVGFLEAYAEMAVLDVLRQPLHEIRGWEAILWATRTHYLTPDVLRQRLRQLNAAIAQIKRT